jgi:hypothetical protein
VVVDPQDERTRALGGVPNGAGRRGAGAATRPTHLKQVEQESEGEGAPGADAPGLAVAARAVAHRVEGPKGRALAPQLGGTSLGVELVGFGPFGLVAAGDPIVEDEGRTGREGGGLAVGDNGEGLERLDTPAKGELCGKGEVREVRGLGGRCVGSERCDWKC